MNKQILLLPLLIVCQFIFAQKPVTNLHYVWTEYFTSPKKTDVNEKFQFNFNWNPETQIFATNKNNVKGKIYQRHVVDLKRRIIVVQMETRNDYVLEEYDSFFLKPIVDLEPIEEIKEINGLKCRGYTFTNDLKITDKYGKNLMRNPLKEEYSLWVTNELEFNDELNPVIVALLRKQSAQGAKFNGVLVRLGYKISYGDKTWNNLIDLDTKALDNKLEEPVTWPWLMPDATAWLEMPNVNSGTTLLIHPGWKTDEGKGGVYRIGDGSAHIMNLRLKALLFEITGQEKPKTTHQYFQNIFDSGPWGN